MFAERRNDAFLVTSDAAVITKMTNAFTKANSKMHAMVQAITVSCVLHAVEHGRTDPANAFIKAFSLDDKGSNGWRLNALRTWFEKHGPMVFDKESKSLVLDKVKAKALREQGLDVVQSRIEPITFWTETKEAKYKGFDLNKAIFAKIKEAEAILKDDAKRTDPNTRINIDKLIALKAFMLAGVPNNSNDGAVEVLSLN